MRNSEVRAQAADPNRIRCRDCIYRDRDTMVIDGETIQTGVMRGRCLMFDGKSGNWKPIHVTMYNENCMFYEQDETADRYWERKKG